MNIEDKEEISNLIDKRIKDSFLHTKSSPQTLQIFSTMQTELKYIKEKIEKVPTKTEMELANEKLVEKVLNKCDTRYATKALEKIVIFIGGAVIVQIIGRAIDFFK